MEISNKAKVIAIAPDAAITTTKTHEPNPVKPWLAS